MPVARVSRLGLEGYLPATKRARVSRLALDGTVAAGVVKRARISRLALDGTYANKRARVSELRFTGSTVQTMVPNLVASPATAEPGAVVTISAAGTTGHGVTTAWEITAGGAGVALTGTGLVQTLVAPRDYQGRTITVQVEFLDTYGATDTRAVTVTVRPQQWWFCTAAGMVPVPYPFLRL